MLTIIKGHNPMCIQIVSKFLHYLSKKQNIFRRRMEIVVVMVTEI